MTVHAAEFPRATGAALCSAPCQALATLFGAPPPWDVGFLPTYVLHQLLGGSVLGAGPQNSVLMASHTHQGKAIFLCH